MSILQSARYFSDEIFDYLLDNSWILVAIAIAFVIFGVRMIGGRS
jgi:hypothetical protein